MKQRTRWQSGRWFERVGAMVCVASVGLLLLVGAGDGGGGKAGGGAVARNVALALEVKGAVAVETANLAVRSFSRLRAGMTLVLGEAATVRLLYSDSGVTEFWTGPAKFRVGEQEAEPLTKESAARVMRTRPSPGPNEAAAVATLAGGPKPGEFARPGGVRVRNGSVSLAERVRGCDEKMATEGEVYAALCRVGVYIDAQKFSEAMAVLRELERQVGNQVELTAMRRAVQVGALLAAGGEAKSAEAKAAEAALAVDVWVQTSDGRFVVDGGELELGATYEVHVTCSRDCYVRVVGETPDAGTVCQYSPSQPGERSKRLRAGEDGWRLIEPSGAAFAVAEPVGVEDVITVYAVPADGEEPFAFVGREGSSEACEQLVAGGGGVKARGAAGHWLSATANRARVSVASTRFRAVVTGGLL